MINRTVALKYWKRFGGNNEASVKNHAFIVARWGWNFKEAMKLFTEFLQSSSNNTTVEDKE